MCRILILYVYYSMSFYNLLRIFKDGAHRSKTEFMLVHGSGVNFAYDTDIPLHRLHCSLLSRFGK